MTAARVGGVVRAAYVGVTDVCSIRRGTAMIDPVESPGAQQADGHWDDSDTRGARAGRVSFENVQFDDIIFADEE
jgi:hypothetical protein